VAGNHKTKATISAWSAANYKPGLGMPKRNQRKVTRRFSADDIVRTVEAMEKAGLTVHSVEITKSGSIKIETQPSKRAASSAPDNANVQTETTKKKPT